MNPAVRQILFWMCMVLMAVILWQMAKSGGEVKPQETSYSELLAHIEKGNVSSARVSISQATATVAASLPKDGQIKAVVPMELLPDLTRKLAEKRVPIHVEEVTTLQWPNVLMALAPVILIVGLWVFMVRQMQAGKKADLRRSLHPQSLPCFGIGYDLHRLESGRKLILGGVEVPFDKGPAGHSDGDVLSHAICDALLGAAGLGDIGTHFPDTDVKWRGASSLLFLEHTRKLIDLIKLRIAHIDAVVITERPRLGPHFPAMREALARALGIDAKQINLKAKTNEGVDAIGRGEAIAAHAIASLEG